MSQTFTRLAELRETRQDSEGRNLYRFLISTPGKKGDGLDIPIDTWDLSRFQKHPNVLVNHNIMELPIGRAERVWTDDTGLWADVRFSASNPRAVEVRGLIDEGILSSTSVNFRPHNVDRQTGQPERTELVELSIVSVPEDADVLMARSMWPYHGQHWQGVLPPWNHPLEVTGIGDQQLLDAYTAAGNLTDSITTTSGAFARLSISTIWDAIKDADIADLEWHMKDSLNDVRVLAAHLIGLGLSDDLVDEMQDTIVALRVLFPQLDDQDEPEEEDEVITIDLSKFPALTGATK